MSVSAKFRHDIKLLKKSRQLEDGTQLKSSHRRDIRAASGQQWPMFVVKKHK